MIKKCVLQNPYLEKKVPNAVKDKVKNLSTSKYNLISTKRSVSDENNRKTDTAPK